MTTYRYSRIQRALWRIGDLIGKLLLGVALIGSAATSQQCGRTQIPVLKRTGIVISNEGGRRDRVDVPEWSCAPEPQ